MTTSSPTTSLPLDILAFRHGQSLVAEMLALQEYVTPLLVGLVKDGDKVKEVWRVDLSSPLLVGAITRDELLTMTEDLTRPGISGPFLCDYVLLLAEGVTSPFDGHGGHRRCIEINIARSSLSSGVVFAAESQHISDTEIHIQLTVIGRSISTAEAELGASLPLSH